jgi:peptidoglycan/LPS O-acetylase OafA/YrhL
LDGITDHGAWMFSYPVPPSMDIRGWIEMYPLNGPAWTLFFEYIANVLYGAFVRKFSNFALSLLVFVSGAALIHLAVTNREGDVIGGWALEPTQLYIGFVRLAFPFFGGLLLSRVAKLTYINNAFFWSSVLLMVVLAMPRVGGSEKVWINGLYDSLTIILIFPVVVYLGASGDVKGKFAGRICKFLGDISYPMYITHYPIIYIYTGWVHNHHFKIQDTFVIALLTLFACIILAYVLLKSYDLPVRKSLMKRFSQK